MKKLPAHKIGKRSKGRIMSFRGNKIRVFFFSIVMFSMLSCLFMGDKINDFYPNANKMMEAMLQPNNSHGKTVGSTPLDASGSAPRPWLSHAVAAEPQKHAVGGRGLKKDDDDDGGDGERRDDDDDDDHIALQREKGNDFAMVLNADIRKQDRKSVDKGKEKREQQLGNNRRNKNKQKKEEIKSVDKGKEKREQQLGNNRRNKNKQKKEKIRNEDIPFPLRWHGIRVGGNKDTPSASDFPVDFKLNPSPVDILDANRFNISSLHRDTNLEIVDVPHLGVLLDAGRHYFPVDWIKRMIDVLSIMNFNLLHFRLTDDQTFNVRLESQPRLAHATPLDGNTKVYSPKELRDIVQYAKQRHIRVVPEINVPGHSGSWAGIPGLILQCPRFICEKGYGIPLNISHPELRPVLRDVLKEVVDIFDDPPFLHLGGDEVNMAMPCFKEIGETMFDYNEFETMLSGILKEIRFDETKVIRWEMSEVQRNLQRAGDITHFWFRRPGEPSWKRIYPETFASPVFLSSELYFDVNEEDSAFDIYIKTKKLKHHQHPKSKVLGIIGGTFELGTQFWHDRNVVGRLLAIAMGASAMEIPDRSEFLDEYGRICRSIGLDASVCQLYGVPPKRYLDFRSELKDPKNPSCVWSRWIQNTCEHLTVKEPTRVYIDRGYHRQVVNKAQDKFWNTYTEDNDWGNMKGITMDSSTTRAETDSTKIDLTSKRLVKHTGVIMDIARYPTDGIPTLQTIAARTMNPLGLNTIQLRLITDVSFAYYSPDFSHIFYKPKVELGKNPKGYGHPKLKALVKFKEQVGKVGVGILPEIAISTNAGGMFETKFNVKCPNFSCDHWQYIPQDIEDGLYPALVYTLVRELSQIASVPYIHLGHDEREKSTPCFLEAKKHPPNFDKFEGTIRKFLEFLNIDSDRVVRWENSEQNHYPGRFGSVTQCRAKDGGCTRLLASADPSLPWFGTVDIQASGAYDIYLNTRELASHSPIGLMADIGRMTDDVYLSSQMDYRLLAFAMGTLDVPLLAKQEFEKAYVQICLGLSPFREGKNKKRKQQQKEEPNDEHEVTCRNFIRVTQEATQHQLSIEAQQDTEIGKAMCEDRARNGTVYKMRDQATTGTSIAAKTIS